MIYLTDMQLQVLQNLRDSGPMPVSGNTFYRIPGKMVHRQTAKFLEHHGLIQITKPREPSILGRQLYARAEITDDGRNLLEARG